MNEGAWARVIQDAAYEQIRGRLMQAGQTQEVELLDRWVMLRFVGSKTGLRRTILREMGKLLGRKR